MVKKFIHAGEIYIGVKPTQISTVLGSCVAVCLYDRVKQIAGMNHYLLPFWGEKGLHSRRYGSVSIPKMVEDMFTIGCKIDNLEAKIFGGANVLDSTTSDFLVGKRNIIVAKEILREYKIGIKAEDVGGSKGRYITLFSESGKVYLRYVKEV